MHFYRYVDNRLAMVRYVTHIHRCSTCTRDSPLEPIVSLKQEVSGVNFPRFLRVTVWGPDYSSRGNLYQDSTGINDQYPNKIQTDIDGLARGGEEGVANDSLSNITVTTF